MLTLLLNNWKAIVGAITAFLLSYYLHTCSIDHLQEKHAKALEAKAVEINKQCDKDKAITSEVSRDYQEKLTGLNKQLADAKRLFNNRCMPITRTTSGHDGSTAGGHAREYAIPAEHLLDYGALAKKYTLQLISCQNFVRKERE